MLHISTIFHFYIPHVTFLQHFPGLPLTFLTFLHHFQLFTFWADTSNIEIPAVKKHKVLNIHTTFSPLLPLGAKKSRSVDSQKGFNRGERWATFTWENLTRHHLVECHCRHLTGHYLVLTVSPGLQQTFTRHSANDQMIMITTIFWITNKILRANRNSCWINTIFFVSETCHHHHH